MGTGQRWKLGMELLVSLAQTAIIQLILLYSFFLWAGFYLVGYVGKQPNKLYC